MYQKVCCTCKAVVLTLAAVVVAVSRSPRSSSPFVLICSNIAFSLTWPASMQVHWNKRKRLHKKRVRLAQDWDTNMAAVSLFRDTNMAAVTSCENTL